MCRKNSKTDPVGIDFDPTSLSLDEIARLGAQKFLYMAVKAEVNMHIEQWQHVKDEQGRPAVVRNGYQPERAITIDSGRIAIKVPRTRTRREDVPNFTSTLVPKYMRRSPTDVPPILYHTRNESFNGIFITNSHGGSHAKTVLRRTDSHNTARQEGSAGTINMVCRKYAISELTYFNWRTKYSGMGVREIRRLRELEAENVRLKRIVAERDLEIYCQHRFNISHFPRKNVSHFC